MRHFISCVKIVVDTSAKPQNTATCRGIVPIYTVFQEFYGRAAASRTVPRHCRLPQSGTDTH